MKRFFFSLFACIPLVASASIKDDMLVGGGGDSATADTGVTAETFLRTGERYMLGLTAIVAVAVFIWFGYRLFSAQGNPEEFKKVWIGFVYAVVGLAVIPLSYAVIRITLGFTL